MPVAARASATMPPSPIPATKRRFLTRPPWSPEYREGQVSANPRGECKSERACGLGRGADQDEVPQDSVQVRDDLRVGERLRDVLADRVEAAPVLPGVEDVPEVGVPVHRVDAGRE